MKAERLFGWSFVLALALVLVSASAALSCTYDEGHDTLRCNYWLRSIQPILDTTNYALLDDDGFRILFQGSWRLPATVKPDPVPLKPVYASIDDGYRILFEGSWRLPPTVKPFIAEKPAYLAIDDGFRMLVGGSWRVPSTVPKPTPPPVIVPTERQFASVKPLVSGRVTTVKKTTSSVVSAQKPIVIGRPLTAGSQMMTMSAVVPRGDSPGTARDPVGNWEFAPPNTTIWYKMNDMFRRVDVWLDTGGQPGFTLDIYAPDQTDLYGRPVGRGTPRGPMLFWTGRSPSSGIWYMRVTNNNSVALPYNIKAELEITRLRDFCTSCHGNSFPFDECESKDPAFCENLPTFLQK